MTLETTDLDRLIPLTDGSHADVTGLAVDIPLRYAECLVMLADGRTARLKNRNQFLGWTFAKKRNALYFRCGREVIRIETDRKRHNCVSRVDAWPEYAACRALSAADPKVGRLGNTVHKIVAPDGNLLFIAPEREATEALRISTPRQQPAQAPASLTI
ncbi:MAG: hypothetical protein QNJ19_06460 [Woeseiaceae bacterium]|nr:hypothetical protein [Woeseiaceae bacterium]